MNDAFKSYGYHSSKGIQIEHCNCINASKFTVLAQTARSFPLSWSELFCAPNSHLPSNCPNNCRSLSHEKKSSIHERMWAKIKHTYTKDLGLCSAKTAPMENTQNSNQASEAERTFIEEDDIGDGIDVCFQETHRETRNATRRCLNRILSFLLRHIKNLNFPAYFNSIERFSARSTIAQGFVSCHGTTRLESVSRRIILWGILRHRTSHPSLGIASSGLVGRLTFDDQFHRGEKLVNGIQSTFKCQFFNFPRNRLETEGANSLLKKRSMRVSRTWYTKGTRPLNRFQ